MRVYSIQESDTWFKEQFNKEEGYHFASWDNNDLFMNDEEFNEPYIWMRQQLEERLDNYSGDAPIWAWAKRIKLRKYMRGNWGFKGSFKRNWILVEAEVPESRVLLSCYNKWHLPLNNGHFTDGEYDDFKGDNKETWHHIFDLTDSVDWLVREYGETKVQACIDRVYSHEIVSVHKIQGRKRLPYKG